MKNPTPLRIHCNKNETLVMYNGRSIDTLAEFHLVTHPTVVSGYHCVNCFPETSDAPDDALSPVTYPLHVVVGRKPEDCTVYYAGRPASAIKKIEMHLFAEKKHQIRFEADSPLPEELVDEFVKLGIEIVMKAPNEAVSNKTEVEEVTFE